ncbi:MAG: penicillin-binding protein 2, partial [Candidatus Omnitrophica bacterium]|nr:penicillin-binding protein 2 [Candidatus Omnitrophota bacterium]
KRFVWVKRKISWEDKQKIKEFNLSGIGFFRDRKRFYPQNSLASAMIGIVGIDNNGLEGLERSYNDYLGGKDGLVRVLQDSTARKIMFSEHVLTPQRGADITLTIDAQIQFWSEYFLDEAIKQYDAESGSAIVMEATTGRILALANRPGFDPNNISDISPEEMRNRAIADMFEPGSVFKVVALLAAINENKITNDKTFFCENGDFKIPGTTLHDWRPYANLTFEEVFKRSSNIGVAKIVQEIGPEAYFKYLDLLEIGKLTGIDLPSETPGSIKSFGQWSRTSAYIIPIGQEVAVNILHLARIFASIANDGYLVRPYVVEQICSRDSCRNTEQSKKKIFKKEVAERARGILIQVVEDGTGKQARVEGMALGGKTGTAQKFDPSIGRYSPNKYRASFAGFSMDVDPPIVIAVSIDEPKKSHFGGVVAAPVFKKIAEKLVPYLIASKALESN